MSSPTSKDRVALLLATIVLLVYLAPLLLQGEESHVPIHDNLDSRPLITLLKSPGMLFAPNETPLPQFMNGLPRGNVGSEFHVPNLVYWAIDDLFTAYALNQTLLHLAALLGMYLFLGELAITSPLVRVGAALCFALLPHYPPAGFSVPALPLMCWVFLRIIRRSDSARHWITLALLPLFSPLFGTGLYLLVLLSLLWLVDAIRNRRPHARWFFAMAFVSLVYIGTEYRLVERIAAPSDYVSHRSEFVVSHYELNEALAIGWENFWSGQMHVSTFHFPYIWIALLLAIVVGAPEPTRRLLVLLGFAALLSLWFGIYRWQGLVEAKAALGPLMMLQWDRFYWLHPLLWYSLFALALRTIAREPGLGRIAVALFLALQLRAVWVRNHALSAERIGDPTWRQFFAADQFKEIETAIGRDPSTYRVASLGLPPIVPLVNGLYCLDGYWPDYDVEYKHAFRKVIAPELEKSDSLSWYFDAWGSRAYIFSSHLDRNSFYTKADHVEIPRIDLDLEAFSELGGTYILSAVRIVDPAASGLSLVDIFEHDDSAWRIHLYEPLSEPTERKEP